MGKPLLTVQTRTLRRAVDILGGKDVLRAMLHVPMARLEEWLEGAAEPPMDVFLKAVDVISTPTNAAPPSAARARVPVRQSGEPMLKAQQRIARALELRDQARARPKAAQFLQNLFAPGDRMMMLESALDAALEASDAQMGNVQIKTPDGLRIVAQRGFSAAFLEFFSCVTDAHCACGSALARGARVLVDDVASDPIFCGTDAGRTMIDAGALAVQSTPLVSSSGEVLGMVSTHYREAGVASAINLGALDLIAQRTSYWLDQPTA